MNCDDIKIMIFEYLDDELPKGKEAVLFTHLSICDECREEFKTQNLIKHEFTIHQKEVSENFEKRIFASISKKEPAFAKKLLLGQSPVYFNYLLAVILIIITILLSTEIKELKMDLTDFQDKYINTLQEYKIQNEKLNAIYTNSNFEIYKSL